MKSLLNTLVVVMLFCCVFAAEIFYKVGRKQGIKASKNMLYAIALLLLFFVGSIITGWIYWGSLEAIFSR